MKLNKLLFGIVICCTTSVLWVSCKKTDVSLSTQVISASGLRLGGAITDDGTLEAKVPLLISANFLTANKQALLSGQLRTTPVKTLGGKDNTPPVVSITSPLTGVTVSGTVSIAVSATDNVGVSSVSVSVDGTSLGSKTAAPFTFSWNTSGVASGTHTITATAKDAAGNTATATIKVGINATVAGDITAPVVNITSPADGSSYTTGTAVSVAVNATDNVGVSSVSFSVDGVLQSSSSASPYSFSWNTTGATSSTHTLTATAKDAAGNSAASSVLVTLNTTIIQPPPLPSSYLLATPPVTNQGNEGSCSAFSTTYDARSIEQYYRTGATGYSYSTNIFSPAYVYNQVKFSSDCYSGTSTPMALDLLINKGVCTWQTMPYSDVTGCNVMPTAAQDAEAANYKIAFYSKILNTDLVTIKTMITQKHAVIINITADNGFINAGPGFIWSSYSGSGALPHGIIICGYDDAKHAYKVMNSWGTGWGDAGYSWIDYTYFTQVSGYYVYAMNY